MKRNFIVSIAAIRVVLCPVLAACGSGSGSGSGSHVNDGPPMTITVSNDFPPAVVAFRDGVDAGWEVATQKTSTTFEAVVHGPYLLAIQCVDVPTQTGQLLTGTGLYAKSVDDPMNAIGCAIAPVRHLVTGHMAQPGFLRLGDANAQSTTADWDFQLWVPNGSYDLIATTTDQIAIRRELAVNDADVAVTPPVDVTAEGTAFVDVAFTAPNATPDETLSVAVGVVNNVTNIPARIYQGPVATAKAAPDAALLPTDVQSASVRVTKGNAMRALRRPFRVGGDTVYMLPPAIGGVQWSTAGGQLSVSWTSMPDLDVLYVDLYVTPDAQLSQNLVATPGYLADTGVTQLTLATDFPGFQPAWKADLNAPYTRDLIAQKGTELATVTTSEITETVGGASVAVAAPDSRPGARDAAEP
jgi:hypothetical protein